MGTPRLSLAFTLQPENGFKAVCCQPRLSERGGLLKSQSFFNIWQIKSRSVVTLQHQLGVHYPEVMVARSMRSTLYILSQKTDKI